MTDHVPWRVVKSVSQQVGSTQGHQGRLSLNPSRCSSACAHVTLTPLQVQEWGAQAQLRQRLKHGRSIPLARRRYELLPGVERAGLVLQVQVPWVSDFLPQQAGPPAHVELAPSLLLERDDGQGTGPLAWDSHWRLSPAIPMAHLIVLC